MNARRGGRLLSSLLRGCASSRGNATTTTITTTTTTTMNTSNDTSKNSMRNVNTIQRQFFNSGTNPLRFAKGKGKAAAQSSAETNEDKNKAKSGEGGMSLTHCTGANYFKNGEDPKLLPDEEYPDWLWDLLKPPLKISDYEKRKEEYISAHGEDSNWEDAFTWEEMRKWRKLVRRAKIKKNNAMRARK